MIAFISAPYSRRCSQAMTSPSSIPCVEYLSNLELCILARVFESLTALVAVDVKSGAHDVPAGPPRGQSPDPWAPFEETLLFSGHETTEARQ